MGWVQYVQIIYSMCMGRCMIYLGPPPAGCVQVWQYWTRRCRRSGREWTWPSGWGRDPDNLCLWSGFGPFLDRPADRTAATPCSGSRAPAPPAATSHNTSDRSDLCSFRSANWSTTKYLMFKFKYHCSEMFYSKKNISECMWSLWNFKLSVYFSCEI